jgi:thioredoxin 1
MQKINTGTLMKCLTISLFSIILVSLFLCVKKQENDKVREHTAPVKQTVKDTLPNPIIMIKSEEQFKTIIDSSGERLLVIDFYADWCVPCKVLAPTILEIAREHSDKASFYKLDVDKLRKIAAKYRVMGIPYIVFIKNKEVVHTITGISPKEAYLETIKKFTQSS